MPIFHLIDGTLRATRRNENAFYTIQDFKSKDTQDLHCTFSQALDENTAEIELTLKELDATYVDHVCLELAEVDRDIENKYKDKKGKVTVTFILDKLPLESIVLFYKNKIFTSPSGNFTIKAITRIDHPDQTSLEKTIVDLVAQKNISPASKPQELKKRPRNPRQGLGFYEEKFNSDEKTQEIIAEQPPAKKQTITTSAILSNQKRVF